VTAAHRNTDKRIGVHLRLLSDAETHAHARICLQPRAAGHGWAHIILHCIVYAARTARTCNGHVRLLPRPPRVDAQIAHHEAPLPQAREGILPVQVLSEDAAVAAAAVPLPLRLLLGAGAVAGGRRGVPRGDEGGARALCVALCRRPLRPLLRLRCAVAAVGRWAVAPVRSAAPRACWGGRVRSAGRGVGHCAVHPRSARCVAGGATATGSGAAAATDTTTAATGAASAAMRAARIVCVVSAALAWGRERAREGCTSAGRRGGVRGSWTAGSPNRMRRLRGGAGTGSEGSPTRPNAPAASGSFLG
jgi:hypothetical protein